MHQILLKDLRIPVITTDQMKQIDNLAVNKYNLQLIQMMENAGRSLAKLTKKILRNSLRKNNLIIAVGKGNNGGGGIVAARHLNNWGAKVTLLLPQEPLSGVPEIQRKIIQNLPIQRKIGKQALQEISFAKNQIILDAMIGYGLKSNPKGWVASMINKINALNTTILSLDVPSGLDASTGKILNPCIKATATMTLALPKTGLLKKEAKEVVGSLYLCDIGIPSILYKEIGLQVDPIFIRDSIIKLEKFQEIQ
jgi:NAD(P)H-hydrate epimerase